VSPSINRSESVALIVTWMSAAMVYVILLVLWDGNHELIAAAIAFSTYIYMFVPVAILQGAYRPWREFMRDVNQARSNQGRLIGMGFIFVFTTASLLWPLSAIGIILLDKRHR